DREPLDTEKVPYTTLKRWMRYWAMVRHRDGAERTLLTALTHGSPQQAETLYFSAVTDRFYGNTGHPFDFGNKAFELVGHVGGQAAINVLPTILSTLAGARGSEETNAWRHPIDLVPILNKEFEALPALLQ